MVGKFKDHFFRKKSPSHRTMSVQSNPDFHRFYETRGWGRWRDRVIRRYGDGEMGKQKTRWGDRGIG